MYWGGGGEERRVSAAAEVVVVRVRSFSSEPQYLGRQAVASSSHSLFITALQPVQHSAWGVEAVVRMAKCLGCNALASGWILQLWMVPVGMLAIGAP